MLHWNIYVCDGALDTLANLIGMYLTVIKPLQWHFIWFFPFFTHLHEPAKIWFEFPTIPCILYIIYVCSSLASQLFYSNHILNSNWIHACVFFSSGEWKYFICLSSPSPMLSNHIYLFLVFCWNVFALRWQLVRHQPHAYVWIHFFFWFLFWMANFWKLFDLFVVVCL